MAKIVKKISATLGFSKKNKTDGRRSFVAFVESYVDVIDPKSFDI